MGSVIGFWSYARRDDEAEGGRISRLSRDIAEQYSMRTGDPVDIWLDLDRLRWGDRWREDIQDALGRVRFFIPVITPRYFQRVACRRELILFTRTARYRGAVLPVLYADLPDEHPDFPDPARQLIDGYQRSDWRELRDEDPDSSGYRRKVRRMAMTLADAEQAGPAAADAVGDPDALVQAVVVGVAEMAHSVAVVNGLLASPGDPGLPAGLDAQSRRLLGVAHTLSGDVHDLAAALGSPGSRPGWSVTGAGQALGRALAGGARLAAAVAGLRPDDRTVRAALERIRLALLLADDCTAVAEQWTGGDR
ncbi:TIR domain-containing protein [Actinokineospora guangxiensis]|uniref:TIR domain-containing protein n=1 Tax=Actinokineospora guangxiensis TaxID=1490288 RepID=A0ABW0EL82_9PSEU